MGDQLKIFVSYSHEDEIDKDELLKYLKLLEKEFVNVATFHDGMIRPGNEWNERILNELYDSNIVLFLISIDFLVSDYIDKVELKIAELKAGKKQIEIIPIIIKKVQLNSKPFLKKYQGLPKGFKPVESYPRKSEAWDEIYTGLRTTVIDMGGVKPEETEKDFSDHKKKFREKNFEDFQSKNKIYLALNTSSELTKSWNYLYDDLMGKIRSAELPYEIIPKPSEVDAIKAMDILDQANRIQTMLNQSSLSIHLFDPTEEITSSLEKVQYQLAQKKCSSTEFKCILSLSSNALDKTLENEIEDRRRRNPNIVKLTDKGLNGIKDTVLSQIDKQSSIKTMLSKRASEKKTVYFLFHKEDVNEQSASSIVNKVITELESKHKVTVIEPVLEDSIEAIEYEKKELFNSDGAIVFYGYGNRNWWAQKKSKIVRADHLICKAVCFNDPDKENKVNYVSKDLFTHINNTNQLELDIEEFASCLKKLHA